MNKAILPLLFFLLLAVVFSGCLLPETEIVAKAKQLPSVASFLAAHPNAQLTFTPLSRQQSQGRSSEFIAKCGSGFAANDYYYILFSEGNDSVEVLAGQKTKAITCIHRSDDLCISDEACDDKQACTIDSCMGAPKECEHQQITQCAAGDSCCPAQCSYKSDSDCEIPPPPECTVDSDCDDFDQSTLDSCNAKLNECRHAVITACVPNDNYCPSGCNYATDADCEIAECTADANCNDNDSSTADKCAIVENVNCDLYMPENCLEMRVCTNEKITKCSSGDGYCPVACDNRTDWDCLARPSDIERIIVKCGSNEAKIDGVLFDAGNWILKANIAGNATNTNNKTLLSYSNKEYKYNSVSTSKINMSEKISVAGTVFFDKEKNRSKLLIDEGKLSYTVDLGEGIPATGLPTKDKPFFAESDDKIIIPLFGTDSLVALVDKANGEINIVTNQKWVTATTGYTMTNVKGKNGETFAISISRCDVNKAVFSLKKDGVFVATQTASAGDMLFRDRLDKIIRINYYHRDSITKMCDYQYSIGDYLETIRNNYDYPIGSGSDWQSELVFDGKKLQKIIISNKSKKFFDNPLSDWDTIKIFGYENTASENFCTLTFNGLTR